MSMTDQLHRLTQPQLECLHLVAQHKSSKEIAIQLKVTSHAIDARIKRILSTLGVASRHEAARMYQGFHDQTYQPLVCPSPDGAAILEACDEGVSPTDHPAGDRPTDLLHAPAFAGMRSQSDWSIALPFRTNARPVNDLPWGARLAWMTIILVAIIISVTLLISTAEGLSRLL